MNDLQISVEYGGQEHMPPQLREQFDMRLSSEGYAGADEAAFLLTWHRTPDGISNGGGPIHADDASFGSRSKLEALAERDIDYVLGELQKAAGRNIQEGCVAFVNLSPHASDEGRPMEHVRMKAETVGGACEAFRDTVRQSRRPKDGQSLCQWAAIRVAAVGAETGVRGEITEGVPTW